MQLSECGVSFFFISSLQHVQRVKQSQSCTVVQTLWHCRLQSQEKIHLSRQMNRKRGLLWFKESGEIPIISSLSCLALKVAQVIWSSVTAQVTKMLRESPLVEDRSRQIS